MDGSLTATVCTVVSARRCDPATDGPHSRVAYADGAWWRWLPMGGWTESARVDATPTVRAPSLPELAASVPTRDRPAALIRIGVPADSAWGRP